MMGQNSFSGTVSTNTNEQRPVEQTLTNQYDQLSKASNTKTLHPKTIILIIVGLLVGAGITTTVFLLLKNRAVEEPDLADVTETGSPESDGIKTTDQVIDEFNDAINSATDEADKLDLLLDKVDYYILNDDYSSALSTLETIGLDSLSNSSKQIVYNRFATVYEGKGDNEQAIHYKELADQAFSQAYEEQQGDIEESVEEAQADSEPLDEGEEE